MYGFLLEKKGLDLRFKAKNDADFDNTLEIWSGYKFHFARGYRNRYTIDESFKKMIEEEININGKIYKPKLLSVVQHPLICALILQVVPFKFIWSTSSVFPFFVFIL